MVPESVLGLSCCEGCELVVRIERCLILNIVRCFDEWPSARHLTHTATRGVLRHLLLIAIQSRALLFVCGKSSVRSHYGALLFFDQHVFLFFDTSIRSVACHRVLCYY
jgi:hypothetical protein